MRGFSLTKYYVIIIREPSHIARWRYDYAKGNLLQPDEEKRQRIFQAAVSEFASHKFSEASLNRIVKAAKIPWGSFYQYFEDKEDLYLYVIKEMSKYKWDALKQAGVENMAGDF